LTGRPARNRASNPLGITIPSEEECDIRYSVKFAFGDTGANWTISVLFRAETNAALVCVGIPFVSSLF